MIIFTRKTKKAKIFRLKCHHHLVKLKDAVMNEKTLEPFGPLYEDFAWHMAICHESCLMPKAYYAKCK